MSQANNSSHSISGPMSRTRQRGENMRVQAYVAAAAAVARNRTVRQSEIDKQTANANNLSEKSKETFAGELFSVTDPKIAPIFPDIMEFAHNVQSYPRVGPVRREHALTQEVVRLVRTLIGDFQAISGIEALDRAKARFTAHGDYDPDGLMSRGSPGRGWRQRL